MCLLFFQIKLCIFLCWYDNMWIVSPSILLEVDSEWLEIIDIRIERLWVFVWEWDYDLILTICIYMPVDSTNTGMLLWCVWNEFNKISIHIKTMKSGPNFIILKSDLGLIQYISCKIIHISNNFITMNLHKHQLYLLEQHSESFKSWSAIIRINTEGKSLIMKFCPVLFIHWALIFGEAQTYM